MSAEHLNGWHVAGTITRNRIAVDDGEGREIAIALGEHAVQHAHLIATAPRLLEFATIIAGFTPPDAGDDNAEAMSSLIRSAKVLQKLAKGGL